jgi:hypothetical protein
MFKSIVRTAGFLLQRSQPCELVEAFIGRENIPYPFFMLAVLGLWLQASLNATA